MANSAQETLTLALAYHQAARREAAEALYRQVLDDHPDNPTALYLLGWLCFESGKIEGAVALLGKVVALRPDHAAAREALAQMLAALLGRVRNLLQEGKAAEAREALNAIGNPAALADPLRAEAWFLTARVAKQFHEFSAAIAAYQQAIAIAPLFPAAHLDLGNCFAATDRPGAAERALRKALAIEPELKEAHASLGSVLLLTGREREAEECSRAALTLDPTMIAAHQNLAAICAETGREAEAKLHRDAAYCRQNLFIERAARPQFTVLMPTTAEGGNVPGKFLFPREHCTVLKWFVEYARSYDAERLPAYDLVFNGIGDPDAAEPAAIALAECLARCRAPILNPPAAVATTRRDGLGALLAGIERIVVPDVWRINGSIGKILFPVLLRPCGSHGGAGVKLIQTGDELDAALGANGKTWYATQFFPYRSADGWHRKYRVIFINGQPFPYHLALSRHWLVHYVTADMQADPMKSREEQAFLEDPERAIGAAAMAALAAIGARLELDFAGIDFSVLADGRLIVFEANATMLVHPEPEAGPSAYRNPSVSRILDAFWAMLASRIGFAAASGRAAASDLLRERAALRKERQAPGRSAA